METHIELHHKFQLATPGGKPKEAAKTAADVKVTPIKGRDSLPNGHAAAQPNAAPDTSKEVPEVDFWHSLPLHPQTLIL